MRRFSLTIWAAAAALLLVAAPAFADTVEYCATGIGGGTCATTAPTIPGFNGFLIKADLSTTGSNFSLSMTFTNDTSAAAYLNEFTINLLGGGSTPSITETTNNLGGFPGWAETDNAKINNSTNVPSGCKGSNGTGGWLCASSDTAADTILLSANGGSVTLTFGGTFTGSVTTPFDLMANGGTNNNPGDNKAFAISDNMDTPPPITQRQPPPTPEPASLALFGTGLVGIAGVVRRKIKK